jgi:pimeloyl-ACP methyl ester carboxylesterase
VGDLVAAARFLESKFEAPSLLVGHSFGGAAVIHAASRIPSTAAVATISAPAGLSGMIRYLRKKGNELKRKGETEIAIAGRSFTVKEQLLKIADRCPVNLTLSSEIQIESRLKKGSEGAATGP